MRKLILLIFMLFICRVANATTVYININCANDGDGSTNSCASAGGGVGYYNNWTQERISGNTTYVAPNTDQAFTSEYQLADNTLVLPEDGLGTTTRLRRTEVSGINQGIFYSNNNNITIGPFQFYLTNCLGVRFHATYKTTHHQNVYGTFYLAYNSASASYLSPVQYYWTSTTYQMHDNTASVVCNGSTGMIEASACVHIYGFRSQSYNWDISETQVNDWNGYGVYFDGCALSSCTGTPHGGYAAAHDLSPYGINTDNVICNNITRSCVAINVGVKSTPTASSFSGMVARNVGGAAVPNVNAFQLGYVRGANIQRNYCNTITTSVPDGACIIMDFVTDGSSIYISDANNILYNEATGCNSGTAFQNWRGSNNVWGFNKSYSNISGYSLNNATSTGNVYYRNLSYADGTGYIWGAEAPASTFIGNIATESTSYALRVYDGGVAPTENHNLITGSILGIGSLDSTDKTTSPIFVDAANHNFLQKINSPSIDSGATYGNFVDAEGKPCIGAGCDIGASEGGTVLQNGTIYNGTIN